MRKIIILVVVALAILSFISIMRNEERASNLPDETTQQVFSEPTFTPISHATFVLEWGNTTMYFDPVGGKEVFAQMAAPDVIFITDIHQDHLDINTLSALIAPDTLIFAPQAVADTLPDALLDKTVIINNGQVIPWKDFNIVGVPMYNIPESEDTYHPKGRGNGYIVENGETRVYVAGDTSNTPELRSLKSIDIAFLPMNLPYTMSVEEAAEATLVIQPQKVYPYHYRGTDGLSDIELFKNIVTEANSNIEVVLLNWYPESDTPNEG